MSSGQDFADMVTAWCKASEARMLAVRNESVQRLVAAAQEAVPVDTGFLRASLVAIPGGGTVAPVARPEGKRQFATEGTGLAVALAETPMGSVITVGWAANYAAFVEFGARGRPPVAFARQAAQRWPQIVANVAAAAFLLGNRRS